MKSNFLHLRALHRRFNMFLVNRIYAGTNSKYFEKKRKLLIAIGYEIGEGTKIVGPIECYGNLIIGSNCWIGKNLKINGIKYDALLEKCRKRADRRVLINALKHKLQKKK